MATTAMVHVRVDQKMKARAEKALSAMGLSVSDAVRVLLTRVAAEQALPFEVRVPNSTTRAAMKEARRGGLRSHATVKDLLADLDAEDRAHQGVPARLEARARWNPRPRPGCTPPGRREPAGG